MDREDWWATVHGVAKSWTPLSDYHNRFVKAFLPRSKHLLISWLQSPSAVDSVIPNYLIVTRLNLSVNGVDIDS